MFNNIKKKILKWRTSTCSGVLCIDTLTQVKDLNCLSQCHHTILTLKKRGEKKSNREPDAGTRLYIDDDGYYRKIGQN